jgi:lysophospholipase L1-like esterase
MGIVAPPGITLAQYPQVARFGLLRSRRLLSPAMAALATGRTYHGFWVLEGDFDAVRLVFENDTTSTYTVDKCSIAAVGKQNAPGLSAVDANGTAVSWTQVTFNNAGADGYPPSPSGSTASLAVPAAVTAVAPKAYGYSDWMRVSSIAPFGGGTLRYLATRAYSATAMRGTNIYGVVQTDFNPSLALGRQVAFNHLTGDFTDGTGTFVAGSAGVGTPLAVQYYARARGATVLSLGDSLTQGSTTSGNCNSFVHQACAALSVPATRPVSFVNGGWSGQLQSAFYLRGKAEIDAFRPDVVTICVASPNDGATTLAGFNLMFSKAIDLAHYAITKGATPILVTAGPFATYGTTGDTFRKVINARVVAMGAAGGMLVCDASAVVTDGGSPQELPQVQYQGSDGQHLNDAAHTAIAAVFTPVLRRALGS